MAAAATLPLITIDEYLHTTDFEPDADYVDGHIEERPLGEWDHGDLQSEITGLFRSHARAWGIRAAAEIRVRVSPTRFRVPDVCVVAASEPKQQIVTTPPVLCIEVLSPEDRLPRVLRRVKEFIDMGVPEVWIFDPATRTAHVLHTDGTVTDHRDGTLRLSGTPIELPVGQVFSTLDE